MSIRASAPANYGRRKITDYLMRGLTIVATAIAVVPLVLIIGYVVIVGGRALNVDFFTKTYEPPLMAGVGSGAPSDSAPADAAAPSFDPGGPAATANPAATADPNATADPFAGIGTGNAVGTGAANATPGATADPNATADPFAGIGTGNAVGTGAANATPAATAAPGATADPFAGIGTGNAVGTGAANATPGASADPNATAAPTANTQPDLSGGGVKNGSSLSQAEARGGVAHAIIGTLLITALALLFSLPIGVLAGIFLAEYPSNIMATVVRFCTDLLSGSPSIIAGVTAYILIVVRFRQFSGVAGAIAITILMVPTIVRTTEEVLKLVPESIREAALAMGAPTWYATFTVVVPSALGGIITGVMLAFARGAGETAPLILTVLGSNVLSFDLLQPIAALPLITYRYTESPFPGENTQAWGSAFVLLMLVLVVNIAVRLATRSRLRTR